MKNADVAIIGGGLAGLTAAIHLAKLGYAISLFEKEKFPQHKVCGEYLSNEVLPYLQNLNADPRELDPVFINKLILSSHKGKSLSVDLALGGMGISRHSLDHFLYKKALSLGVQVIHEQIVNVHFYGDFFELKNDENTSYYTKLVLGAFGKRSVLDKHLDREFIKKKSSWLAVKAHYIMPDFPDNLVGLHNFKGGYCGLSKIETGKVNVCYLATYNSFKKHKNPKAFEEFVLKENKYLKDFFSKAKMSFKEPLSIAQVSFRQKSVAKDHILMLGDAAGLIHPLCGNGMAMAIHSAKIASETVDAFLKSKSDNFKMLETQYTLAWNSAFKKRLKYGKWLQNIMLKQSLAEASTSLVMAAPFILPKIIKQTHGTPIL